MQKIAVALKATLETCTTYSIITIILKRMEIIMVVYVCCVFFLLFIIILSSEINLYVKLCIHTRFIVVRCDRRAITGVGDRRYAKRPLNTHYNTDEQPPSQMTYKNLT